MPTSAASRWEPVVRRARQSGVSIQVFAREHGLNAKKLAWWDKHFVGEPLGGTFVEATVAEPARCLHLRVGRVEVDVDVGTDLTLLRRVVEALS